MSRLQAPCLFIPRIRNPLARRSSDPTLGLSSPLPPLPSPPQPCSLDFKRRSQPLPKSPPPSHGLSCLPSSRPLQSRHGHPSFHSRDQSPRKRQGISFIKIASEWTLENGALTSPPADFLQLLLSLRYNNLFTVHPFTLLPIHGAFRVCHLHVEKGSGKKKKKESFCSLSWGLPEVKREPKRNARFLGTSFRTPSDIKLILEVF